MIDQTDVLSALSAHLKERGAIAWYNVENAADFIAGHLRDRELKRDEEPAPPVARGDETEVTNG